MPKDDVTFQAFVHGLCVLKTLGLYVLKTFGLCVLETSVPKDGIIFRAIALGLCAKDRRLDFNFYFMLKASEPACELLVMQ